MNSKIIYVNNDLNLLAAAGSVPVVKRKSVPQIFYPASAYDDYGVSDVYSVYPSFNTSILFIVIAFLLIAAQFAVGVGMIICFILKKKSIRCKYCGKENFKQNGEFPVNCAFCGKKLRGFD